MMSKAEFISENLILFLYICSIYVATTHLATTFYKIILFSGHGPEYIMVVTSLPLLGQGETGKDLSKL